MNARDTSVSTAAPVPDGVDMRGIERVLVLKLRHHGDVLLTTPVWGLGKCRIASSLRAFPCRPCGYDGGGGGKVSECLTSILPSQVLAAIDDLMRSA